MKPYTLSALPKSRHAFPGRTNCDSRNCSICGEGRPVHKYKSKAAVRRIAREFDFSDVEVSDG